MNKLIKRMQDGTWYSDSDFRTVMRRLHEYENTGLTPEDVAQLKAELIDERYRHDRLQDFEVAEAQELAELKRRIAE